MNIKELFNEWTSLCNESIGFQRAGIDDQMTKEMHDRDNYVYHKREELESILFPLLTDRITLYFDKTDRPVFWQKCDEVKYKGYIQVDSTILCDTFSCETVSGSTTFAKKP